MQTCWDNELRMVDWKRHQQEHKWSEALGPVDNWVAIRRVPCYLAAMHAGTAAQAREQVT